MMADDLEAEIVKELEAADARREAREADFVWKKPKALDGEILTGPFKGMTLNRSRVLGGGATAQGPFKNPEMQPKDESEVPLPRAVARLRDEVGEILVEPVLSIGGVPAVVAPTSPNTSLGRQTEFLVEHMSYKHAVIGNVGGKCRVLDWIPSLIDPEVLVPSFQTVEDFKKRYNDLVPTESGLKKQGELYLGHSHRAKYDGITFLPGSPNVIVIRNGRVPTTMLNIWKGWGVEPRPGDWRLLKKHIDEVLAAGNVKVSDYIKDWAAVGFQRPGQKRGVTIVFQGDEGVGKGTFGHVLRKTYGPHGLYISQPTQLTGKFNRHLWTVCYVFADEAFYAGDREGEGILKALITDKGMMVEPKGVDAFPVPNYLDFLMASNNKWVVPVGPFGRRFAVFAVDERYGKGRCSDAARQAYFKPLYEEIANGGVEAMMWDLMQRPLGGWNAEAFPVTAALMKQKQQTLRGFDKAFEGWLQLGTLPRNDNWSGRGDCATTEAMIEDVRKIRGNERETDSALKAFLAEFKPVAGTAGAEGAPEGQLIHTGWRVPGLGRGGAKFPALPDCRAAFGEAHGGGWPWDESVTEWEVDGGEAAGAL
jgi:Family of unknown function (DUF5906)